VRKLWLFAALGWTLTILYFCLASSKSLSAFKVPFLGYDKVLHAGIFFTLVILWLLYYQSGIVLSKKKYAVVALIVFLYGVLIEILQKMLTQDRHADFFDVLANSVGIVLAIFIFNIYTKIIRK